MVTFLIIILYIALIGFDLIPNIKNNKDKKGYIASYLVIIALTGTIVILRSLKIDIINTFDIIHLFQ